MAERYLFTKERLKTMLLGLGYSRVAGLDLGSEPVGAERSLNELNALASMGLIESDGTRFIGSADAKIIAEKLATSSAFLALHSRGGSLPDICVYPGNILVTASESLSNNNSVSIAVISFEELFSDLSDEGYFPEDLRDAPLDETALAEFEENAFASLSPAEPLTEDCPVCFSAELISSDGALLASVRLTEYYLYRYIYVFDGKTEERVIYTPETLKTYLKKAVEKNDIG